MASTASNNRLGAMQQLQPLLLLCTGTLVVVANQVVSNQAATNAKAQLLTVVRYLCTFGLSAILVHREKRLKTSTSRPQQHPGQPTTAADTQLQRRRPLLLLLIGCLDVGCYAVYNLGFAMCGSAVATVVLAATGQIATAIFSVLALKRQLRLRHVMAVVIVTIGLVLRSMDDLLAGSSPSSKASTSQHSRQAYGVLCVMLSALLFSILGVLIEMRSEAPGRKPSQAQMSFAVSGVSLCLTLLHQLLYCLPNWQELVAGPFAASGLSVRSVVLTHTVYGLITAVHQYVQVRLLSTHGAMTVGLVNAVRASVVSVVSSWLFCAAKPQLCLTYWRGISALVVTLGAMQWVFAGKPLTRPQLDKKQA